MNLTTLINMAGGIGLILLGMKLMSNGLRMVAGGALRKILANWTDTPVRGLMSGIMITSAVQSSSAVTVATIGFVNAGLMTLTQAMWMVYGSNVGTTTTAWIVAFLGLKINVQLFALPLIALGMAFWITSHTGRRSALGEALTGFGLFFLGIEFMQSAFALETMHLPDALTSGSIILGQIVFVGIGFLLTFLMQSSSGAMALVLSASAGGFMPISLAAAAVIGANVGTTTTGALAAIGATPNAKRVAAGHVVFNILTGIVALLLLPLLLGGIFLFRNWLDLSPDVPAILAVFHTIFNVLGVMLLWRFTPRMVEYLSNKFRTAEEDESQPKYLDNNILVMPGLALNALLLEVGRIGQIARRMTLSTVLCTRRPCDDLKKDGSILEMLIMEVGQFAAKVRKEGANQETAELFPEILRAAQYFNVTAEKAVQADRVITRLTESDPDLKKPEQLGKLEQDTAGIIESLDEGRLFQELPLDDYNTTYQNGRKSILAAGSSGLLTPEQMIGLLDYANHLESALKQYVKGKRRMAGLQQAIASGHESFRKEPAV